MKYGLVGGANGMKMIWVNGWESLGGTGGNRRVTVWADGFIMPFRPQDSPHFFLAICGMMDSNLPQFLDGL